MKNICIHNTGNGYCMAFDRPCNNESCNEYCAEFDGKFPCIIKVTTEYKTITK